MQLSKAYIKQSSKSQPNLRDICGLRKLFPTVALYFLTFVDGEKYARHIELRRSRRDIGPRSLAHATTSTCKSASGHGHAEPGMVLLSSGRVHPVGGLVPGFLYRRRRGPATKREAASRCWSSRAGASIGLGGLVLVLAHLGT